MGKETVFMVLALTYIVASEGRCKLCDFDKRFEHVRPTCSRRSKADDTTTTGENVTVSTTNPTTTTDTTSRETGRRSGIDCFENIGNKTFWIKNGSSTINANCTRRITCINGEMNVDGEYHCSSNATCKAGNDGKGKCYCIGGYYGDGESCTILTNCQEVFKDGYTTSTVYSIKPSKCNGSPFDVYCNMSHGGGWTVFQRRMEGSVNFYRNWTSYKEGFGELDHEFWLGNDKLYYLTNQDNSTLRIDLVNRNGDPYYAEYDMFRINDESDNYRLSVLGAYHGTARSDALISQRNHPFSTRDRDNDASSSRSCAFDRRSAFWFDDCTECNLNGDYHADSFLQSIYWLNLQGSNYNIKYTEMKIRPK